VRVRRLAAPVLLKLDQYIAKRRLPWFVRIEYYRGRIMFAVLIT
jgi:hypothetical protein